MLISPNVIKFFPYVCKFEKFKFLWYYSKKHFLHSNVNFTQNMPLCMQILATWLKFFLNLFRFVKFKFWWSLGLGAVGNPSMLFSFYARWNFDRKFCVQGDPDNARTGYFVGMTAYALTRGDMRWLPID